MSEHNPPEHDERGRQDDADRWISELYDDADAAMPPQALDASILQAAAKKFDTPLSSEHRQRNRWAGGLATAAIVVITASVFFSGEVAEQMLSPAPAEIQVSAAREQNAETLAKSGKDEARNGFLMQRVNTAPEADTGILDADDSQLEERAQEVSKRRQVSVFAASPPSNLPTTLVPDCSTIQQGICIADELVFAVHPACSQNFGLPPGAKVVRMQDLVVTFELGAIRQSTQCVKGQWATPGLHPE